MKKSNWQKSGKGFNLLRSCNICHLNSPPINWLCPHCWGKLQSFYLLPQDMVRKQEDLTHIRLFDWNKENDFFIRIFLNSLKGGGPSFIFNQVILDFLHRILQAIPFSQNAILIPAPSHSQTDSRDHAFCLASSFSFFSGVPVKNLLTRPFQFDKKQKRKIKWERKTARFCIKENFIGDEKMIIFIDDILTTGATAQAAWKALGEPEKFIIFTLTWRDYD